MSEQKTKLKLCSIWQKTINTKNGEVTVFNGNLGDLAFEIWPNGFKTSEKSPTHIMYVKEKFKKDEAQKPSESNQAIPVFSFDEPLPF